MGTHFHGHKRKTKFSPIKEKYIEDGAKVNYLKEKKKYFFDNSSPIKFIFIFLSSFFSTPCLVNELLLTLKTPRKKK